MKINTKTNKVILSLLLVLIINTANAQPWTINGNTNTSNGSIFGPINPGISLNIYTGGSASGYRRMYIADGGTGSGSGFVGIGNNFTTPAAVLHVNAINNGTGEAFRTNSNSTSVNAWRMFTGTGNGTEKFAITNTPSSNLITLQSSADGMSFNTGGANERMRILSSGNVGIGINAPVARLHIVASANSGETFRTLGNASPNNFNAWRMFTGAGAGTEKFSIYTAPTTSNPNSRDVIIQATQSGSTKRFNVGATGIFGGTVPVSRMIITDGSPLDQSQQTGLIGMGNDFLNPKSQLHLNDGGFATHVHYNLLHIC